MTDLFFFVRSSENNMPPKVYNIDVRSVDRNRDLYPNAEDFVIDLGRTYKNVSSLKLGSLEVPNTPCIASRSRTTPCTSPKGSTSGRTTCSNRSTP